MILLEASANIGYFKIDGKDYPEQNYTLIYSEDISNPSDINYTVKNIFNGEKIINSRGFSEFTGVISDAAFLTLLGTLKVLNLGEGGGSQSSMSHGRVAFEDNATETIINTVGVFVPILGTFLAGHLIDWTANLANGELTYIGADNQHAHIVTNISLTAASNNQVVKFQWYKNGVVLIAPVERLVATGADIGAFSVHADTPILTGDVLQLKCANETSTANLTVKHLYKFIMGMKA